MLYVGIDPGEAHCGFAALEITGEGMIRVEARTYSVTARHGYLNMAHAILDLLPHAKRTHIVCEDFRIRRVGHQKFNAGNTLRFLGALEYGIKQIDQFSFSLVPPSDHWERENRELYGRVIFNYRKLWPKPHDAAWNHCMSAWRALGHGLMALEQPQLLRLHHAKKSHRTARWLPVSEHQQDHVAPAAWWMK